MTCIVVSTDPYIGTVQVRFKYFLCIMYEVRGHTFILGQNKLQNNSEHLMPITVVYLEDDTALRPIHHRTGLRASN